MRWGSEIRQQRDRALIQLVEQQAKLRDLSEQRDALRSELAAAQQRVERVVDNALFAAGAAPVFHPEDARFQPKPVEHQMAEVAKSKPVGMNPAEWRQAIERAERERAERDRKASMTEALRRIAEERKRGDIKG